MKKISLLLLLSMLAASGCGKSGLAAGQISYSGKTLTYGENKVDDVFFTDGVELTLNNENEIRSITITNKDVKTYKDISVGDKIEKVQFNYNYENEMGDNIFVTINGDKEIARKQKINRKIQFTSIIITITIQSPRSPYMTPLMQLQ